MSAIALERPRARAVAVRRGIGRATLFLLVLAALWGSWEGYRWLWMRERWTWPFRVDDTSMPHLHSIFQALWAHARPGGVGPRLITLLFHAALFTAKEAAVGFALGAVLGFVLGVLLAQFRILQRGFLPWVVASQTVRILWKLRVPAALPYIFAALKVSATASVVGAIIGELPSSIQDGLGGQIINYSQYYTTQPTRLWATNVIAAALGISFFLVVLIAEKLVVRRAPEHVA